MSEFKLLPYGIRMKQVTKKTLFNWHSNFDNYGNDFLLLLQFNLIFSGWGYLNSKAKYAFEINSLEK